MPAKRVTLQDIAKQTGFTVNTVSRALKNKPDISTATCERIQQVAREMGYVRNFMASSLRSGCTKTVGVILGNLSNPFYGIMADAIQDAATALGYSPMILCSRDDPAQELSAADLALSRQVDGILLFPQRDSQATIQRINDAGVPLVLLSRAMGEGQDCVLCDEEQGAYLATQHLIDAGRRKLGYLCSHDVFYSVAMRLRGFLRACEEGGVPEADRRIALCASDESLRQTLHAWHEDGIDGLFVFCDMEAWNVIALLRRDGLSAPSDFAIATFDNIQGTLPFPFPLCSVDGRIPDIARNSVELLLGRIRGDDSPPQHIVYPAQLICRSSCGKA